MKQIWIADRLKQLDRTQIELAHHLDIPAPRVSEIISGRRKIQVNELPPLTEFLGVNYSEAVRMIIAGAEQFVGSDLAYLADKREIC